MTWIYHLAGWLRYRWVKLRRIAWVSRLLGYCLVCGEKLVDNQESRGVFYHRFPEPYWCHTCNKLGVHARNYGMGVHINARR